MKYEFNGKKFEITGHIIYQGRDYEGPWEYEEFTLDFDNGKRAWLENDEGQLMFWEKPFTTAPVVHTTDGQTIIFDRKTKTAMAGGKKISLNVGKFIVVHGKKAKIRENSTVRVTSSNDDDMDVGEELWYIDLWSGTGPKMYTLEIYQDNTSELSEGRRVFQSDFPWIKTMAKTPLGGDYGGASVKGGKSIATAIGILILLFMMCGGLDYAYNMLPGTYSCKDCVSKCGDLTKPLPEWSLKTDINCNTCAQMCIDANGVVDPNKNFTISRSRIRGPRSRGYGGGFGK